MRVDVGTTTLWAELAGWSASALEAIGRPEHWAIHGTTRMGKALTRHDRLAPHALSGDALAAGVRAAGTVLDLLGQADPTVVRWSEPPPPAVANAAAAAAAIEAARCRVAAVAPSGIELLLAVAHALQAGQVPPASAGEPEIRALVAVPPRSAPRPDGPFSALLVASAATLWLPTPLARAWDGPAWVVASSAQLRADLAALPPCLRRSDDRGPEDLVAARALVAALSTALERAGDSLCVRTSS